MLGADCNKFSCIHRSGNKNQLHVSDNLKITLPLVQCCGSSRKFLISDVDLGQQMMLVYFKQLDETVSKTYCANDDCSRDSGGNYTYGIPVSSRFPQFFVTLKFV